ncbi:DUF4258 domain-containing protein [Phenylobacterium sp.]|uniref:DUF4258 domain-containing protein n=1 Tax=Phenylobacterium sp. TaxID=1871053 RepID=UPI003BAA54D9
MGKAARSNKEDAASRLRAMMNNGASVWYTRHAERDELPADGIAKIDVENMLRRCSVGLIEDRGGEETWHAQGKDNDGRALTVVVVAYDDTNSIKVITGWAGKRT